MPVKDEFEFLNSPIWLEYTQQRYLSPDEMKQRLQQLKKLPVDWSDIANKIIRNRKIGSIPFFLKCVDKKFWLYPSDSLIKKIDEIEKLGLSLYNQINQQSLFAQEFFLNSTIEEAITSAIYEGAHSTRAQAQQLIASGNKPKNKDEWMLVNNFEALSWVEKNRGAVISKENILEIHRIVTQHTMEGDDANFSGKFRNDKVFIGPHEGIQHGLIDDAISEMIALTTQNPRFIHPLLRAVLFHYFIAYIHPFFDGNGRTARALFYFKSMKNDLDYVQLLSVSAYLKEHGKQYEKAFEKVVENDFDVTYFVDFCLDSIHSALRAVSKKVIYLLHVNELRDKLDLTANQVGLLQRMALHKFRTVNIEEYAKQINKSREVARQELKILAKLELVHEKQEGKKLVYCINKEKLEELVAS